MIMHQTHASHVWKHGINRKKEKKQLKFAYNATFSGFRIECNCNKFSMTSDSFNITNNCQHTLSLAVLYASVFFLVSFSLIQSRV